MGPELTTFLTQLADAGEREYLKTTAVGEYRAIPGVETVKTASGAQHVETRTEIEVIGVAQDDLSIDLFP